jgi:magnesium transporter
MSLESRLEQELVRAHPDRAAAVLDRVPSGDSARVLAGVPAGQAAAVIARMAPHLGATALEQLRPERAAEVVALLDLNVASRLWRRFSDDRRAALMDILPSRVAAALRALLQFPEKTAGALMDPGVLALPGDLTAREALARVREVPEQVRYNLYVVDRDQVLVGVLNLRELLLARPQACLTDVMTRDPVRLVAQADQLVVVSHPVWKDVRAIPVVDDQGCYLGAVRYRTLRQIEEELFGARGEDGDASEALGQLFAAGAAGLLDALTGAVAARKGVG